MPEQVGQAAAQPKEKKPGFDEFFAKGWDTIEADEAAAAAKPAEKTPLEAVKEKAEDCPDCPGGKAFKVLKHNGKEVFVKTEKEHDDLAQMGFDYTKKTQALAEERKAFTAERDTWRSERQQLLDRLERIEKGSPAAKPGEKTEPAPKTAEEEEAAVFTEYGLDPEFASGFEKRMVKDVVALKRDNQGAREISQMLVLREMTKTISGALAEAAQEFPVEDVLDDKGQSVTANQVMETFKEIMSNPANQKTPVKELARAALKRVSDAQQAAKGASPGLPEDATLEDLRKRFPKAFEKFDAAAAERDDLPPSIAPRKTGVQTTEKEKGKKQFKGLDDAISAAMEDPELKDIFGG